jgi:DNA-binding transcriptional regulator YbjK
MSDSDNESIEEIDAGNNEEEEYDPIDITDSEMYQVGSIFFENEDNESIADIVTNLTKVHIALVDSMQELVKQQTAQVQATNTLSKVLQKYCKKMDEKR